MPKESQEKQKKALFYSKLKNKKVQCNLCPKHCIIKPDKYGNCNARKNIDGNLFSLVYNKPSGVAIDPIEKKPLYHFLPGQSIFSVGTTGCNLHCRFCQNSSSSQVKPSETSTINTINTTPKQLVEQAIEHGCSMIAYTYNEPTIFYEYMIETAKLAKEKGLKNIIVSNGFIEKEPLKKLIPFLDAANIDLKSIEDKFYKKYCSAFIKPVLNTLKTLKKEKIHLEITNLIIPTLNNKEEKIDELCRWITENLGNDIPLHFSAFRPCYKLTDIEETSVKTLEKAKNIAEKNKINYIYLGNIPSDTDTYCPKCKKAVIERNYFNTTHINLNKDRCKFCSQKIKGVFD